MIGISIFELNIIYRKERVERKEHTEVFKAIKH